MISAFLIVTSSRVSFSKNVRFMSVKGSRLAPNLLLRRRAPRATPRTSPALSVSETTILSASASLCVCSTMASVSTSPIQSPSDDPLPGNPVEQPREHEADHDELQEYLEGVAHASTVALAPDYPEDDRDERREQKHQKKMSQGFLPAPMSKASRDRKSVV